MNTNLKRTHNEATKATEATKAKRRRIDNDNNMTKVQDIFRECDIAPDVYNQLTQVGIDWNALLYIEGNDLDVLCGVKQLNLTFATKLRFKAAIKRIQSKYQPPKHHICAVTIKEQEYLTEITHRANNAIQIQLLFGKHLDGIENNVKKLKLSVDNEFNNIINNINTRKQFLYTQVNECIYFLLK